jgi:hypothetical protein
MTGPAPQRHWRSYGTDPLPTGTEALDEPLNAFPSWFPRVECDRCDQVQLVNQPHMPGGDMQIRTILDKMRHDGCGGLPGKAGLVTGIEGVSRPRLVAFLRAAVN